VVFRSAFIIPHSALDRCQVEVQAGDEAHEDPHHDARFSAEHEGVGEAEDLVGEEAGADTEDQPAGFFVRRPGIDAPGGADEYQRCMGLLLRLFTCHQPGMPSGTMDDGKRRMDQGVNSELPRVAP